VVEEDFSGLSELEADEDVELVETSAFSNIIEYIATSIIEMNHDDEESLRSFGGVYFRRGRPAILNVFLLIWLDSESQWLCICIFFRSCEMLQRSSFPLQNERPFSRF